MILFQITTLLTDQDKIKYYFNNYLPNTVFQ